MIDLGTLGGIHRAAFATDGTWAVGYSTTKEAQRTRTRTTLKWRGRGWSTSAR